MAKGRKPIIVDKVEFQEELTHFEQKKDFSSRSTLWAEFCTTEWAIANKLKPQTAMLKAEALNLNILTPKGRRGALPGSGPIPNAGKRIRLPMADDVKEKLLSVTAKSMHAAVDKAAAGSLKAAVKLKCLDCSGGYKKEVSLCEIKECALWHFRPYQKRG